MPQLTSGRHVDFRHDRLMAWANAQTDNGQLLRFVISGVEPADLWREMGRKIRPSASTRNGAQSYPPTIGVSRRRD